MVEEWARGTNLEKTTLSKSLPQLQCRHFRPVNTGRLLMVILVFLIKPSRVSFHIISMECLKMWFIERTQRGSVDTREVHTVRTLPTLPDGRTKMLFFQKENVFALQLSLERKKKLFQFKVNQLPSVEPQPPSSSSWRWPGTDLSDRRRGALPVWRQKGDTFFHFGSIRLYRIYSCERGQSVTCCAVLMAKNWCCPSAPHTYPNALLSVTSLAMKEILFTTCSCSITWVTSTSEFFNQQAPTWSAELHRVTWQWWNSLLISRQWSWCPTWKCWSRSSVCVCPGTEQLLPYPGVR